jgi:hypothetical protein
MRVYTDASFTQTGFSSALILISFAQFLYQNRFMTRFQVSDVQLALEQRGHVQKNSLPIGACRAPSPISALCGYRRQPMSCRFGLLLNFLDIQCAQAPVGDQDPTIYDDISHIAPAGVSDKLRHNVDAGA